MDWFHPVCEAFIAGAVGLGIPRNPDYNGGDGRRASAISSARSTRLAASARARAFLQPARRTGRSMYAPMRAPPQIVFEGKRAVGVRYVDDRDRTTEHEVRARREVILCSGTVNTAKLLQISGVGPAALLRRSACR